MHAHHSPQLARRQLRLLSVLVTATALLLGGLVAAPQAVAAVGVPTTYLGNTYGATASPSADKPQSKLWFHDGAWWALMSQAGGNSVSIHELQSDHTWRDTGVLIDSRANSTGDALWSGADRKLYVVSRVAGTAGEPQVTSHTYDATRRTWVQASRTTIPAGGGSESASIDRDSTGRLWVTYTRNSKVWVAYSDTGGANFSAGFTPQVGDVSIAADDLSAVVAFGGDKVGVMYSDQQSDTVWFAVHRDTDPVDVWSLERVFTDAGMADDHINLKQLTNDPSGRVFAAIKTSKGDATTDSPSDPLIGVLTRSGTGTWSFAQAAAVSDGWTRPIIMIDSTNQQLYLFATSSEQGGDILYKKSPLTNVSFSGAAQRFVDAAPAVNNASGSKDPVTGDTGMVVLAAAHGQKRYVHAEMALVAGGRFDEGGGSTDPAPTVTAVSPVDKATGVATSTDVTATFSEDVQGVSDSTFTLKDGAGARVDATVTYAGGIATLDPVASLAAGVKHTATLTGGTTAIRDAAGQPLQTVSWSFTTAASSGDTTAPVVKGKAPAPGKLSVGLAANVSATFSEAVQNVDTSTFTLAQSGDGVPIAAKVYLSSTTNKWVLDPDAKLAPDTWHRVTLASGIVDLAGNALATTTWDFLTGPPPAVSGRSPAANATGVSRSANVAVTFNEAVNGVSGATYYVRDPAGAIVPAVLIQNSDRKWTLDPSGTLAAGSTYTVTVVGGPSAIRDLAGNPLRTVSWKFTTAA